MSGLRSRFRTDDRWSWLPLAFALATVLAGPVADAPADARPGPAATPAPAPQAAPLYMVVFTDGRMLRVVAASLVGDRRVRLDLPGGGRLDVPVTRVDHVVEVEPVEPEAPPLPRPACPPEFAGQELPAATPYRAEIVAAARASNLDPWLVAAVIQVESGFDRWAVSRMGARGLMQLMPAIWIRAGIADPHEPAPNIRAGCALLRRLLDRFKDVRLALAAYNAGSAVVERFGGVPPFRETRDYVDRVVAVFCPQAAAPAERR